MLAADMPVLGIHIGRFRVPQISLSPARLDQFPFAPMMAAAECLADAEVDATAWNGPSAWFQLWIGVA